jgi:hypothetical protein
MADATLRTVLPTIYRQLLRLSRSLDRAPLSKALLVAQPARLFDRRVRAVVDLPALSGWSQILHAYNSGEFYAPRASSSAVDAVKAVRASLVPGDQIDLGLTALRALGLAVQGGESLAHAHGFEVGSPSVVESVTTIRRAPSVRPSAPTFAPVASHTIKPGSLLLTHPVSCLKQPSLHHAVILVVEATDEVVSGVVINKPLGATLGGACPPEIQGQLGPTLGQAQLFKGGDVSERELLILHTMEGLAHSTPIAGGLYATTAFGEVREAIGRTQAPDDGQGGSAGGLRGLHGRVKCCAGYAGWATEREPSPAHCTRTLHSPHSILPYGGSH